MSREIAVTERLISCIKFCLQPQLKYLFFHINTLMVSQPRFLVFPSVFNLSFPPWVAAFTAMSGSSTRRHFQFVNANNLKKSGWLFQVLIGYPSMRRPGDRGRVPYNQAGTKVLPQMCRKHASCDDFKAILTRFSRLRVVGFCSWKSVTKTQTPKTQTSDLRPRKLRPRTSDPEKSYTENSDPVSLIIVTLI